ncbi:MAG: hypothetical protein H8E54_11110 [Candidatus Aminicenantes bacterium]|nr:hypothetical protein [Candidatus Aminicenantes bacterium]
MKSQRRFAPNGVRNKPESVSGFIGISKKDCYHSYGGFFNFIPTFSTICS